MNIKKSKLHRGIHLVFHSLHRNFLIKPSEWKRLLHETLVDMNKLKDCQRWLNRLSHAVRMEGMNICPGDASSRCLSYLNAASRSFFNKCKFHMTRCGIFSNGWASSSMCWVQTFQVRCNGDWRVFFVVEKICKFTTDAVNHHQKC